MLLYNVSPEWKQFNERGSDVELLQPIFPWPNCAFTFLSHSLFSTVLSWHHQLEVDMVDIITVAGNDDATVKGACPVRQRSKELYEPKSTLWFSTDYLIRFTNIL